MTFIRPYQSSDEEDVIHIFRETAHLELREAGDPALHYASYNWARPYIFLVPDHCLVIESDEGRSVGYVLGAPDTQEFVSNYKMAYLPYLESQGLSPPLTRTNSDGQSEADVAFQMQQITWRPESMLVSAYPNLLEQYPGHLHIDILPEYQGLGWGRKMIGQILEKFRNLGCQGVHLGKVGTNLGAGKFYAKLGFGRFGEVMDGGNSGEVGRVADGGIYLVKKL